MGMDAREIVRRAAVAAVAVDGDDRVQASNEAFRCLMGTVPARGEALHVSLKFRDVFGNPVPSGRRPLLELLSEGQPLRNFRLRVPTPGGVDAEVDVSTVLVLGAEDGDYELVYFFSPVRRRRRADELIDRLLERVPLLGDAILGGPLDRGALTPAQLTVLRLLADGKSTGEVAETLGIGASTVRTHVEHILERTETHSRAEAVAWALRRGLL
jgi:DNA-binding CsgD family transcriptional regulator